MKTSKILMAMALPVVFAACTSEELVESTQTNALDNRKVLGDVEFVMGGVDSRFSQTEEGWVFDANDAFGAALVDTYNEGKNADAWKNYTLSKYIQTNYQYAKGEGNKWSTPARMVEGNYVFYAPYNKKHLARTAMETAFPVVQTLDVEDGVVDPYSAINNAIKEGYPFFIDYKFLTGDEGQDLNLTLNFKHIYAYPEVKFVNETEDDITLERFIVSLKSDMSTVALNGELNLTGGSETFAKAGSGIVGKLYNLGTESTTNTFGAWVNKDAKNGKTGATSDVVSSVGAAATTHINVEIPEGLEVKAGEEVVFNIVLPAESYSKLELYAMVDSKKGYDKTTGSITFAPGKRYPSSDYSETGALKNKVGGAFTMTIEEGDDAETQAGAVAPVIVSSTDELIDAINEATANFEVIASEGVSYTKAVAEALADAGVTVTVNGDMTVEGLTAAEATAAEVDYLTLAGVDIKGIATIKNLVGSAVALNEVVVAKDAVLTVGKNIAGEVENNGTVKVGEVVMAEAVTNNVGATMEITAAATAKKGILNAGTLKLGAQLTGSVSNYKKDEYSGTIKVTGAYSTAQTSFDGTWSVETGATLVTTKAATLDGAMTVAGTLEGEKLTISGGKTLTVSGQVNNLIDLKGVKKDAANSIAQAKATIIASEGATFVNQIAVDAAATGLRDDNIITIGKNVTFLGNTSFPTATICANYVVTGNLKKAEDIADAEINTCANTVTINGSIQSAEALSLAQDVIIVNGNLLTAGGSITLSSNTAGSEITVNGNVEAKSGALSLAAKKLTITGYLKSDASSNVTVANATEVSVGGVISANSTINFAASTKTILKGNVTTAAGVSVKSNGNVHIEGNITVSSASATANALEIGTTSGKITVYAGKTLTIAKRTMIGGSSTATDIAFVGETKAANTSTTVADDAVAGKVINNGIVQYAAALYGTAAVVTPVWTNNYVDDTDTTTPSVFERTGYVSTVAPVSETDNRATVAAIVTNTITAQ